MNLQPLGNFFDRVAQVVQLEADFGGGYWLVDVAGTVKVQCVAHVVVVAGGEHDVGVGVQLCLVELAGEVNTAHIWQDHVHECDVDPIAFAAIGKSVFCATEAVYVRIWDRFVNCRNQSL